MYDVGDPDPTFKRNREDLEEEECNARDEGYYCTWLVSEHTDQHVAGTRFEVAHVWDVSPT